MNKNTISYIFLLLLVLHICSCCPTTSQNPLSSPEKAEYDKRIEGTWVQTINTECKQCYLYIGKDRDKLLTRGVMIENNNALDYVIFTMFPTIINDQNFLNINMKNMFGSNESGYDHDEYIIVKYEILTDGNLALYYFNNDPLVNAIKSGKLKGEIEYRKLVSLVSEAGNKEKQEEDISAKVDCVKISDTSENLLNFIKSSDPNLLFHREQLLKRLNENASR